MALPWHLRECRWSFNNCPQISKIEYVEERLVVSEFMLAAEG